MNDGRKKKPQKHQNKMAFKITFDTQALQKQKKVSLNDLCVRCTQQLEWKLQYNKYKKMTQPSRCNICSQKTVYRTYMNACQPCVQLKNICAKCLTPDYQAPQQVKISEKVQKQQQRAEYNNQISFMKSLQQRSRRTVRRNLEKGKITWDQDQEFFVDEQGNKMTGLHFRKGFRIDEDGNEHDEENDDMMDGDDMFGNQDEDEMDEDLDDDEEDEQQDQKKAKNSKNKTKNTVEKDEKQNKKKVRANKQESDQEENQSDVQGDQVDCENDLNFEDEDWQDENQVDDQTVDVQNDDDQDEDEKSEKNDKNRGQKASSGKSQAKAKRSQTKKHR